MIHDEQYLKKNTGKGTQATPFKNNAGKPQIQARKMDQKVQDLLVHS